MENKVLKGYIYIVPNDLWDDAQIIGDTREECEKLWEDKKKEFISGKISNLPNSKHYVQVNIESNPGRDDNWCDHGTPGYKSSMLNHEGWWRSLFPKFLPVDLFKGKKEGDVVKLDTIYGPVELTLGQGESRYGRFGRFEEVLSDLVESAEQYQKERWSSK